MTGPSEFITPVEATSSLGRRPGGTGPPSKRLRSDGCKGGRPDARILIRWLPVEALKPDSRNVRLHSERQVARIADSIAAFGFNVPVLVDGGGGVLAGHGRVLAAMRLGLKEVPTITLDHLNEAERRAFMIADNRLGELASWDETRLGFELQELKTLDLDFALSATGFELSEIDLRIGSGDAEGDPMDRDGLSVDAVDSPSKDRRPSGRPMDRIGRDQRSRLQSPDRVGRDQRSRLQGGSPGGSRLKSPATARAGDAWRLGPHRLSCGDESDPAAFLAIDAAIRRWQAATGESARLHPKGETFASILRARGQDPLAKAPALHGATPRPDPPPP